MKVRTITCHDVYNYGASLQAYALQQYLESLGHEVEIIDFKPWFQRIRYNFWYVSEKSKSYRLCRKYRIIHFCYCIIKNYKILSQIGRKRKFDEFRLKYLKLTKETYNSSDELRQNPPIADIYIAGSDQIWNTEYNNGKEPAYYLDFGAAEIKRISYAASFAVDRIDENLRKFVKSNLLKINSISVREKTGEQILLQLGFENVTVVLDPVFLLDYTHWEKFISKNKYKMPYLLVYDFLFDDVNLTDAVLKIAKEKKLKIFSINDYRKLDYADLNISNAGPIEFLSLIKHADFVVSNSFHATAFSVIFKKQFITYPLRSQKNSSRMKDFLSDVSLLDYFDNDKNFNKTIDYERVHKDLDSFVEKSRNYLKSSLNIQSLNAKFITKI